MRRRTRQNLVLAAAVGLLALTAGIVVRREQASLGEPLAAVDTANLTDLRVSAGDKPARRFERRDGHWWMREPYAMPAHEDAVARLLAIPAAAPRQRHAADRFDPARIGLAPPQALLELGGKRLEFGVTDAIRGDRYVRTADGIALLPDRFSGWLLAPAESEIDHRLAAPLAELAQVRVDGRDHPELAAAWNRVTTSQVVAPDGPAAAAAIVVELADAHGSRLTFRLWRRDDGRYLALREAPALVYPLDEPQMQQLLPATTTGAATATR
ncbi:MAG: hypothetical protein BGP24_15640 [Lysobacterales bacterium 69-70]|nr:hypothetical protein [Xanthomonadaceae bacterium]ODU35588.1 MAG: hypothetical protein ABS97_04215 [Xanthomonadaceae bacterium SCN 69-320]ODV22955.1 MAG: hypothetical protein ABT27_00405 [Xanthomonadaceae bacterium SCN 69-25]OJY96733.1 MAG: hypothetical protein BGP24_15640 [Xanthomonadales bacterium 69-70]